MQRTVTSLAAVALGLTLVAPARAQEAAIAVDEGGNTVANSAAHVLVSTLIDQARFAYSLPNGNTNYTFAHVTRFACTAACTLEVAAMVQASANTTANNLWAICADIDKHTNLLQCPFQGALPTDRSPVIGNYAWSASLAPGTHEVQPTVFVKTGAAGLNFYHIVYRVYQP